MSSRTKCGIQHFYKASALTINAQFGGTLLAPLAHLTNGSSGVTIECGVFVDTLTPPTTLTIGMVAEPQGHVLRPGGLALLALVTRRRWA